MKQITVSLSTGNKNIDNCLSGSCSNNSDYINGQVSITMAEKSPDYLDPHEYTLEQEWKEEEQVFSVTLKIFYFGKEIFNGGFKDKNFLGIETDSLKRLGEEIISGVNSRLTSEQINTSRQPVSFSVGKGRLKIKDSKGTIYMKYGHFDTNILHLTREPSRFTISFGRGKKKSEAKTQQSII
jgi:hypothetical protein